MATFTSRFVQLTNYCLMEYRYSSPVAPNLLSDQGIVINNTVTNQNQFLNVDAAIDDTGNVQEYSALQSATGTFTYLDKDQVPRYLTYASASPPLGLGTITVTSLPFATTDGIAYDEVWFHLVSGYDFADSDGVIFQIQAMERNGRMCVLACLSFDKASQNFAYNADNILLGGKLYDRRVQVAIPSIGVAMQQFAALNGDPLQSETLAAMLSSDGQGFLIAQPLQVSATLIQSTSALLVGGAEYTQYRAGVTAMVPVNQFDSFELLGATIQASTAGDYYEYFATWDGAFIGDWIISANSLPGNQYVILHELQVIEQVGSNFINTYNLQSVQDSNFNQPNLFRPVVVNGATAIAFTIEYTMRLYNQANASQIIRIGTLTDYDPKAWGPDLSRLAIANEPQTYHIYNKVVAGPTIEQAAFINTVGTVQPFTTMYVPSFFQFNNISVSADTIYLDSNGNLTSDTAPAVTTVFGQHQCTIQLSPFDNYFKFTVLQTQNGSPVPLNLGTSASYYLTFIDNSGNKSRYQSISDPVYGNQTVGNLLFMIQSTAATSILNNNAQEFWITSIYPSGAETVLYQGLFAPADQFLTSAVTNASAPTSTTASTATSTAATIAATVNANAAATTAATASNNTTVPSDVASVLQVAQAFQQQGSVHQLSAIDLPGQGQSVVTTNSSIASTIHPVSLSTIPTVTVTEPQPVVRTDTGVVTGTSSTGGNPNNGG